MNVVEQILKKELNLSNDMCDRFLELAETKYLKKKEMFVQQGKVCYNLGIIESGVLRSYIEKDAIEAYRLWKTPILSHFPVQPTINYSKNRTNGLNLENIFLIAC